ncbi:MAG: hypothetical protein H7Z19_12405 [Chitinophagaceae bacterium]|nr:hypothetical protein [Rubrivivax sp.]
MDITTLCRLAMIYAHLMLCVFALHAILNTDLQVLRHRMDATQLLLIHRRIVWLLSGLWASGLVVAAIDLGFDLSLLAERPKLIAKLGIVGLLTLNGLLLRHWCFPRVTANKSVGAAEHSALLAIGAFSTTSWMMAAFIGIARPLQQWRIGDFVTLYCCALSAALVAALTIGAFIRHSEAAAARVVRGTSCVGS